MERVILPIHCPIRVAIDDLECLPVPPIRQIHLAIEVRVQVTAEGLV
jgi:hypothetical protein